MTIGGHWHTARISCNAAPDRAACTPFRRERRIEFANATILDRKSGPGGDFVQPEE
jgi:hypothetical protein